MDWWNEERLMSVVEQARASRGTGTDVQDQESASPVSAEQHWDDAIACAKWLKKMGVKELRYVGPFGEHGLKPGHQVVVRAGARVYSTMPAVPKQGKLTVRAKTVRVARVSPGLVDRGGPEVVVRNPLVTWAGKGGYWCWCDANSVDKVDRRQQKATAAAGMAVG